MEVVETAHLQPMASEWISGPAMAAELGISRQALLKQTPMLAHDRLATRQGRLWRYHRASVLKHYDCYITNWRHDSPRAAIRSGYR